MIPRTKILALQVCASARAGKTVYVACGTKAGKARTEQAIKEAAKGQKSILKKIKVEVV